MKIFLFHLSSFKWEMSYEGSWISLHSEHQLSLFQHLSLLSLIIPQSKASRLGPSDPSSQAWQEEYINVGQHMMDRSLEA